LLCTSFLFGYNPTCLLCFFFFFCLWLWGSYPKSCGPNNYHSISLCFLLVDFIVSDLTFKSLNHFYLSVFFCIWCEMSLVSFFRIWISSTFFFFYGTGVWTQCLVLAR
jgi:hypothetical protein